MKTLYNTVVDGGHFTDSIGVFETEQAAINAGEDWLIDQISFFLDDMTEQTREQIHERCLNGEDFDEILEEHGFDCGYEIYEEGENEVHQTEQDFYNEHYKL